MNYVFATSAENLKWCNDKIIPLSLFNVQKFIFPYCDIHILFNEVLYFKFF